jgi:hypothetical protein
MSHQNAEWDTTERLARHGRRMPLTPRREIYLRWRNIAVFKFIGGAVVYGFALFGLCTYLSGVNNPTAGD